MTSSFGGRAACAWCSADLGPRPKLEPGQVSHGICEPCAASWLEDVTELPRTPAPPREKTPRSTWLTPIANRLDEMGFTLPAKGSREAKAFYGAMTGELERVFKGNGGTDRDKFVAFVVWVLENALGERVASKFEGNPVPAVSYIVAVVAKPETLERYKRAIAPPATPADVERWAAENKRKIDEAMAAGAYGPQP